MADQNTRQALDAERLGRAQAATVTGLGRAQGLFDRLSWIVWGIAVLLIGGVAAMYLVR